MLDENDTKRSTTEFYTYVVSFFSVVVVVAVALVVVVATLKAFIASEFKSKNTMMAVVVYITASFLKPVTGLSDGVAL